MQNRYVGDIGDFGKYGLLRHLSGVRGSEKPDERLSLSIIWYLHPDESHNSDGKHISYLSAKSENHRALRDCDPALYATLQMLIHGKERHVARIRQSGILADDTAYYERSLFYARSASRSYREAVRKSWLQGALEASSGAELVFVDPDNGISETVDPLRKNGPKFVFMEDLRHFIDRDKSLVIYHHLGRRGKAVEQIQTVLERLRSRLNLFHPPWALRFRRGSARAYFVIPQDSHRATLEHRINEMVEGSWGAHFNLVD